MPPSTVKIALLQHASPAGESKDSILGRVQAMARDAKATVKAMQAHFAQGLEAAT